MRRRGECPSAAAAALSAAVVSSAFCLYARVVEAKKVRVRDFALVAASILDTSPNVRRVDFLATVIPRRASREALNRRRLASAA